MMSSVHHASDQTDGRALSLGETCWRIEPSERAALLIDNKSYFATLKEVLQSARRSVYILGWAFDPRTRLAPDGAEGPDDPDEVGRILIGLVHARPALDVRVLVWKSPFGVMGHQDVRGHRAKRAFARTGVQFREADDLPFGACHHQKLVVIDDQLAFCGGGDIVTNRWDSPAHRDIEPRRILPNHARHPARHEVTMMIEGAASQALGDLFRERWSQAAGTQLSSPTPAPAQPIWPSAVTSHLSNVQVGISRTRPRRTGLPAIDEIRRLTLRCIASARRTIYLENQYFTCRAVAAALEARLAERDGPEVILLLSGRAPSLLDHLTMDYARNPLIRSLRAADAFGRLRAVSPRTAAGAPIVVHSKVTVIDDRIVRVGSANLNNRSGGFDTECDLVVESQAPKTSRAISRFRDRLLAHYLGVSPDAVSRARGEGGLVGAIDALNVHGRLAPVAVHAPFWWEGVVAPRNLGDPSCVEESWRWRRQGRGEEPGRAGEGAGS